uniref:lysosomal cobalamin transport escort protein LMBD1-like n=1 Tax=Myxine glutinosa TaxID=7769 RepID=UPI00358E69B9
MAAEAVGFGLLGWPGWLSFCLALLAILAFSWFYIRYYQSWQESEMCSTITAILCLALALMTAALFPVDIFLVSYMKNSNGEYKDWAADNLTRKMVEDSVLYGYYSLYSIMLFCIFFWLPFAYFYYEEKEDGYDRSSCSRLGSALMYSFGFLVVCAVLLLIGCCVHHKCGKPAGSSFSDHSCVRTGGPNMLSQTWKELVYHLDVLFMTKQSSH